MTTHRWSGWTRLARRVLAALAAVAIASSAAATAAAETDPTALVGVQGTDTALPLTESAVTVNGRGKFADLAITVNQTKQLTNQAVSVTWVGGTPTVNIAGTFGEHYLQVMQCWGDDDGAVPGNPGPPPEQCVQGASFGVSGGVVNSLFPPGLQVTRVVSRSGWENFDAVTGAADAAVDPQGNVWRQFRSVTGKVIGAHVDSDFNPALGGGNFWLNDLFNIVTTNEIAGARTLANGTGAELFQVQTGVQSSGLGCGQSVQSVAGGGTKIPQCWLVVVPRGTWEDENLDTPNEDTGEGAPSGVTTSPLAPNSWANRIAIPLEFNPVDSPCDISASSRRIAGNEFAFTAIAKWQPALCAGGALPPFVYAPVPDASARRQLAQPSAGGPGMIAVNRPLDAASVDPKNPVVYAPLTAQGITIGFNVERKPRVRDVEVEELKPILGTRVAELNLTPRLVAKLLTQSYRSQIPGGSAPPQYVWVKTNPTDLAKDPDFLQFNPEFALIDAGDARTFGGLQLPAGNSTAARYVWEWVLADPEAKAWLDGRPDAWGMVVNPVYSTDAAVNPTGAAFSATDNFPKADPFCAEFEPYGTNDRVQPTPLCGTDWTPYKRSFQETALVARTASPQARINQNPSAVTSAQAWSTELPQLIGDRSMLALTDTPSARLFGLQTASLSRAGDNGPNRTFVLPDQAGLTAGIAALVPTSTEGVLDVDPTVNAPSAYPLTTLTYAAVAPLALDEAARNDFAAFLDYAAGPGQATGLGLGQLPAGYVALPTTLRDQTAAAAERVTTLQAPPDTTPPTTAPPTAPVGTTPEGSGGSPSTPGTDGTGGGGGGSTGSGGGSPSASPRSTPGQSPTSPTPTGQDPTDTTTPDAAAPPIDGGTGVDDGESGGGDVPGTGESAGESAAEAPGSPGSTPGVALGFGRFALPGLVGLALVAALGALEITKAPRRPRRGAVAALGSGPTIEPVDRLDPPAPPPPPPPPPPPAPSSPLDFGPLSWRPIGEM